jgi:hypothetical protein
MIVKKYYIEITNSIKQIEWLRDRVKPLFKKVQVYYKVS